MGYVTTKHNEDLGKELNEMISSLGYEVVIKPDDEDEEEEKDNKKEDD